MCLKINFFLNISFVQHLFFTKFCMNDYIIKTPFFHNVVMFDLKGHIRSNKALYVYIFSSNNSSEKPLLSLYATLSFLSLSFSFSNQVNMVKNVKKTVQNRWLCGNCIFIALFYVFHHVNLNFFWKITKVWNI